MSTRKKSVKWKKEISSLARDFLVDPQIIIRSVNDSMIGNESEEVLYERAHKKLMSLAFKSK